MSPLDWQNEPDAVAEEANGNNSGLESEADDNINKSEAKTKINHSKAHPIPDPILTQINPPLARILRGGRHQSCPSPSLLSNKVRCAERAMSPPDPSPPEEDSGLRSSLCTATFITGDFDRGRMKKRVTRKFASRVMVSLCHTFPDFWAIPMTESTRCVASATVIFLGRDTSQIQAVLSHFATYT